MFGLMQRHPLMISSLLAHAARHHATAEVVSATVEGGIHRIRLGRRPSAARAGWCGCCSGSRGEAAGPRRHARLERPPASRDLLRRLRHGGDLPHGQSAPRAGRHRLHHQRRGDTLLFADPGFAPLIGGSRRGSATVRAVVMMTDAAAMPALALPAGVALLCYER